MTLRTRLQRAPLLGFFALTFAGSWACWALSPAVKPQLPWLATLLMFAGSFRHPDPRGILDGTLHQRVDDFCTGFRMAKVQTVQVFKQCCNRFVMCRRHHSVDTHG